MSKKIFVVDDEPSNLHVMKGILSTAGYTLAFAKDGENALKGTLRHKPDLILLDIMMPGIDGYEVCRLLKADPSTAHIPVIFITAMGEVDNEKKGFDLGAVDYIIKPVIPSVVLARVATHLSLVRVEQLEELARTTIEMLGEAGHYNDTDTGLHIWRMAAYARAIAATAGWSTEAANTIELAAPMHDTGKIGIPDAILKAPRKLDPEEWEIMKTHSQIGHDILIKSKHQVMTMAAEIALNHHEHWDGSGYPQGLAGTEIPQSARIVSIADVFDALTMKRPYKEPWDIEIALAEIQKSASGHFDPSLVEIFFTINEQIRQIKADWDKRGM